MPFSADELHELPDVISAPRFATYLQAMGNDRGGALHLYRWNLQVSSAFIVPLQICEVAARNGVAEVIETVHGPNWPRSNGFIRSLRGTGGYNAGHDLRTVAARLPTTGKVIAELKFAFWEKILTAPHDARFWVPYMLMAFPNIDTAIPVSESREKAYDALRHVRKLRNRIAHHEPIFTRDIAAEYARLHEIVGWRSSVAASWMDRIQGVTALVGVKPVV